LPPLTPNASLRWDIVSRLVPPQARTIIEVGCGQGAAGARLAVRSDNYLGVEPDAASCAVAAERLAAIGKGTVRCGTVPEDAPADRMWDLLCSFEVIEHIADDGAALKAWTGVVRPGGWVMLSTPAWMAKYGPSDAMVGHFRRYDPADLRSLMESAGLQDVHVVNYGAGLGHVLEFARNVIGARRLRRAGQPVPHGAPVAIDSATMAELTAGSGRLLQPPAAATTAVRVATAPFLVLQRRFPNNGTGLVAIGQRSD
jgi:SAM-dependent methyltransferase